jgi:hypothetical protein
MRDRQPRRQVTTPIEPNAADNPISALQVRTATPLSIETFAGMDEGKLRCARWTFDDKTGTRQRPMIDRLT